MCYEKFNKDTYSRWNELQSIGHNRYISTNDGFSFSDCQSAITVGDILRANMCGKCLDIGCGLLPLPAYMENQHNITFYGIDPFDDNIDREFEFKCGIGEDIPYTNNFFNGVLFASTIDHMINPEDAIKESYRVLTTDGKLFVWFTNRNKHEHSMLDRFHQWNFTKDSISDIIISCGFNIKSTTNLDNAREYLLVATKSNIMKLSE